MSNTRNLEYWWPNGMPTRWGLAVPWQNYNGAPPIVSMTATQYLNTKFFNANRPLVNAVDSTVYPYHGCIPPFYTWRFDFTEGWAQTNWKTCMYLPMLFMPVTTHPTYAQFKALLAQYPNKMVLIGNEPNDVNQGRVTPAQFAAAITDLRTVAPNLRWVGPNIIFPFGAASDGNLNNTAASCSTLAWMNAYHALVQATPSLKPYRWSFHIYADNTTLWNEYWTLLSQWLIAHNYKLNSYTAEAIWITETAISRVGATVAEQQTLVSNINSYMTTRSDYPIKQCFIYCAVDDTDPNIANYTNNELEAWSGAVGAYNYTTLGQYWDDRLTYWPTQPPYTASQRRPWAAPKRAPAVKVPTYPILAPAT